MATEMIDGVAVYSPEMQQEFIRRVWDYIGLGDKRMEFYEGEAGSTRVIVDPNYGETWDFVEELNELNQLSVLPLNRMARHMCDVGQELRDIIRQDLQYRIPLFGDSSTAVWVDTFHDASEPDDGLYFKNYEDVYRALIILLAEHKLILYVWYNAEQAEQAYTSAKAMIDIDMDKLRNAWDKEVR